MGALRMIYRYWAAILLLWAVVMFFLAGLGAFDVVGSAPDAAQSEDDVSDAFEPHAGAGFLMFFAGILLFLLALAARLGRNRVLLSLAVPALIVLQSFLAEGGRSGTAAIGGLHPVNGLIILGLLGYLVHGAFRRWTDLGEPVGDPRRERV